MADSPIKTILNAITESQELLLKPSDVDPNKQIKDLFGIEEPKVDFSSQAQLTPTKDSPVGQLREKETEMTTKEGKGKKTFKGLADTTQAVGTAKVLGAEKGQILIPESQTKVATDTVFETADPKVQSKVQENRPFIEGKNKLQAGEAFPDAKVNKKGKLIEPFEDYFKRIQNLYADPLKIVALQNEVAKQYAMKYPEYKTISKNLELIEGGLFDFDPDARKIKGLKIPEGKTTGVKAVVTEALENNEGYRTKAKSIDKIIADALKGNKQASFNKLAVQLIGQVDPSTGKPYTPTKINKMIEDRLVFAAARYKGQLDKQIINEVMDNLRGSYSAKNLDTLAKNEIKKVAPKKIAAFTAALSGIIKSGQASDLLMAGTKATGIALPFELLFPKELQAAELYTPEDYEKFNEIMSRRNVDVVFDQVEPLTFKEQQNLLDTIAEERRMSEKNIDSGINTISKFPMNLFGL